MKQYHDANLGLIFINKNEGQIQLSPGFEINQQIFNSIKDNLKRHNYRLTIKYDIYCFKKIE